MIKCNNCGWENPTDIRKCEKCKTVIISDIPPLTSNLNRKQTIESGQKGKLIFWKFRKVFFVFALICSITVFWDVIFLYSHYGPLTPNGNRYHHDFDISTIPVGVVISSIIAMLLLNYPIYRNCHSVIPQKHKYGFFPSSNRISKILSFLFSIILFFSEIIFVVGLSFWSIEYIYNSSRVMSDDIETGLLYFAYLCCVIFWGILDVIYSIIFKKKW